MERVELAVHERGTGRGAGAPALIFLHYFGGSARAWDRVIGVLGESHRCVAIDLRGFGDSSATPDGYAVRDGADDVERALTRLALTRYVMVGHSMGGKIALELAARGPRELAGLILVAPSPPVPEPMSEEDRRSSLEAYGDRGAMLALVRKIVVRELTPAELQLAVEDHLRCAREAWRAWLELGAREDISARMGAVRVPVSVIASRRDPVIEFAMLEREVVGRIDGARMLEIAAVGHLSPIEAPEALAALIGNALS